MHAPRRARRAPRAARGRRCSRRAIAPSGVNVSVFAAPISRAALAGVRRERERRLLVGDRHVGAEEAGRRRQRADGLARTAPAAPAGAGSASRAARGSASAAFCIAGERLCATGQPRTPRRVLTCACSTGGCPPLFGDGRPVGGGVGFELRRRDRELVLAAAVRAGHVVHVGHVGRVGGGPDRRQPRVGDRRRRQAFVGTGVVGRVDLAGPRGSVRPSGSGSPWATLEGVVDARVDADRHPRRAGGCRSPPRSSRGRPGRAPRARSSRRRSAAHTGSGRSARARRSWPWPTFSENARAALRPDGRRAPRRTVRRSPGTGSLRGPGCRPEPRTPSARAAASCARRRGSCPSGHPRAAISAICARVEPSGITTLTICGSSRRGANASVSATSTATPAITPATTSRPRASPAGAGAVDAAAGSAGAASRCDGALALPARAAGARDRSTPDKEPMTLTRARGEPVLEQVRGRAGVLVGLRARAVALRDPGGEALVVHAAPGSPRRADPRAARANALVSRVWAVSRSARATAAARPARARPRGPAPACSASPEPAPAGGLGHRLASASRSCPWGR